MPPKFRARQTFDCHLQRRSDGLPDSVRTLCVMLRRVPFFGVEWGLFLEDLGRRYEVRQKLRKDLVLREVQLVRPCAQVLLYAAQEGMVSLRIRGDGIADGALEEPRVCQRRPIVPPH